MKNHLVKVLKTELVTHNVKRFVVEKPDGYTFVPGQATDIAINKPGLENELRPFTFTCLPSADYLEFMIKMYTDHPGMTSHLPQVDAGDELIVHEVFGTIHFEGDGLFIAGGAGITPFICIFRSLHEQLRLNGSTLLFANRTDDDVILRSELKEMLGENYFDVIEVPKSGGAGRRIDRELLKRHLLPERQFCYVCGPDKFTAAMVETLIELEVPRSKIIIEE